MLDIEPLWLGVLTLNFFVLLVILYYLLYKPLLTIFKEREDTVRNSLDAAKDMNNRREESIARLNREIAETRSKAKEIIETHKAEGLQKQKEILSSAEARASATLDKARADIRADAEKARNTLRAEVDRLSEEIISKLVKV